MRNSVISRKKKPNGFIRGRAFLSLLTIAIAVVLSYFATLWGREYFILKRGQLCSERLWAIETAKIKYKKSTGQTTGSVSNYSELIPYIPFTGFPMCPWGSEYDNKLNLDKKTSCPCNGKTEYEPKNTLSGTNIMLNGYNDLGKKPEGITLYEFFQQQVKWKKTKTTEKKKQKGDSIFDD